MDEFLVSLLETFGYDVFKQGTIDTNDIETNSYFTYFNWQNPREFQYDNKHHAVNYFYQIEFYSNDILIVDEVVDKAVSLLEENGFELEEEPTDSYSDRKEYTCKTFEVNILKRRK